MAFDENTLAPIVTVFYYPEENLFKDGKGHVYTCLHPLIRTDQLFMFRHRKQSMSFINHKFGIRVNLLYPVSKCSIA